MELAGSARQGDLCGGAVVVAREDRWEVLDRWAGVVESAKDRVIGEVLCYRKL